MQHGKFMNRKTSRVIFLFLLFLIMLFYYIRKRGEESIIPGFDDASKKKSPEQSAVKKPIDSHTSHDSHNLDKTLSPEKTPDPFADMEPSTPVLAMLYGKATGRDGNGLPGVLVSVCSHDSFPYVLEVVNSCITDEQGNFRFESLPGTHFCVLATKPGYYLEYEYISFSLRKLSIEKNFEMSQGGLSLAGTVQDKEGRAVVQASLILHLTGSDLFLRETSDAKGCFRFDGLSRESADLTVAAQGFTAFSQIPVIIGKEDMLIVLSSEQGTTIKGKVLYRDTRKPAPDAAIIIERKIGSIEKRSSLFFTAKADEKGDYETISLPPGMYNLWASVMSFGEGSDMKKEITLLEDAGLEIWMDLFLPRMHEIRGWVLDAENRQPVAGALVRTYDIPPITVQTDPQGRFRILDTGRLLSHSLINLSAQAPGYTSDFKTIRNISDDIPPVVMKLRKTACVYGTIYSSSGEPVSHANWLIEVANTQYNGTSYNPPSDEEGRYLEYVPTDWLGKKVYIYAYSPKYGYGYEVFSIPKDIQTLKKDITLSSGVKVLVMVLDKQGEGIKDCQIMGQTWKQNEFALYHSVETDIEGCAVFENLPRSLFNFYARDQRRNLHKTKSLDLSSADGPQEIVFSLDEPEDVLRVVYGRVTDEQGNPLKDVVVQIEKEVLTDPEGSYRVEINSGDMDVHMASFSKKGYAFEYESIDRDKKEVRLDVVLKKQHSMVFFGTMVTKKGDFPTEANIEICMKDENNDVWGLGSQIVSLKQGGVFEYGLDPRYYQAGRIYFIKARDYVYGSGRSQDIKDVGNRSLGPFEIVLSWGMLKGYLRDGKTGNTVSHGLISTLEIDGGNYDCFETMVRGSGTYTKSDVNGYFELSPLPTGTSEIYIYHPEYWIQKKTSPEITGENLEMEWNPVLDSCASLEGRILSNDGTPLSSVEISLSSTDPSQNNPQHFTRNLETDDQGRYFFKGIPLGEYHLSHNTVEVYGYNSCYMRRENLRFSEPEQRFLDIYLPQMVPAIFETKNPKTIFLEPLYPAEYTKLDFHPYHRDPDNGYRILLPPGRYRMRFESPEKPVREIEILPTGENRITIEDEK